MCVYPNPNVKLNFICLLALVTLKLNNIISKYWTIDQQGARKGGWGQCWILVSSLGIFPKNLTLGFKATQYGSSLQFSPRWPLFSSSSRVLPKPRVRCVQTLLQGRCMRVCWWSAHEWGCVPSNVTPWTLLKSVMHLTRWHPNHQRKPIDLPENTKLWLPSNSRLVKRINPYEMACVKMVYTLTMAAGSCASKSGVGCYLFLWAKQTIVWLGSLPLCVVIKRMCDNTCLLHVSQGKDCRRKEVR